MARIELHGMFYDIRNKVGNLVYSEWRTVHYVRQLVIPANPQTVAQQAVRDSLARVVHIYQNLQAAAKAAWNYVSIGQQYSGYNRAMSVNRDFEEALTPLTLTPATDVSPLLSLAAVPGAANQIDITFTPTPVPAGNRLDVYVRKENITTDRTVQVEYVTYAAGQTSPKTITSAIGTGLATQVYGMLVDTTLNRASTSLEDDSLIG